MKENVLTYEQARPEIENGDIIFFYKNKRRFNLIHFIIALITGPIVHVGVAVWLKTSDTSPKRLMLIEAQGGTRRRVINMSFYATRDMDVVTPTVSWDEMEKKAMSRIGEVNYNWIEAFYIGVVNFMLRFGIKLPRIDMPGEVCSEFVSEMLGLQQKNLSPTELWNIVTEKGKKIKLRVRHSYS